MNCLASGTLEPTVVFGEGVQAAFLEHIDNLMDTILVGVTSGKILQSGFGSSGKNFVTHPFSPLSFEQAP